MAEGRDDHTMIGRIWRTFGLKPHITRSFKMSPDPQLVAKVRDVVGLYMDPPRRGRQYPYGRGSGKDGSVRNTIALAALAVIGSTGIQACIPVIGVQPENAGSSYRAKFEVCGLFGGASYLTHIEVAKMSLYGERGVAVCVLDLRGDGSPHEVTQWTYGEIPDGFVKRMCEPLEPGQTYRLTVSGKGRGVQIFTLDRDGAIKVRKGGGCWE